MEPAAEEEEEEEAAELSASAPGAEPKTDLGAEPKTDLTTGITAAFDAFKAQLEEHFTVSAANHLIQVEAWISGWD